MLTDEQIRALHDRAATLGWLDVALKPDTIRELCTRVLEAEAKIKVLEDALLPFALLAMPGAKRTLSMADYERARKALEEASKAPL